MKAYLTTIDKTTILLTDIKPHVEKDGVKFVGYCTLYVEIKDESDPEDKHRKHDSRYYSFVNLVGGFGLKIGKPVAIEMRHWPKESW